MAYQARVFKVIIASPDDVKGEREIAREVIWDWNYLHSERTKIVLMPIGWETHSAPEMGDRPQAIINKQVLEGCDLLIGIFRTRLGTPTGQEESGTVEEIKEHVGRGKLAMLYFSLDSIPPNMIDTKQLEKLKRFKEKCQEHGLTDEYKNISAFKDKLSKHLVKTVGDNNYFKDLVDESTNPEIPTAAVTAAPEQTLSKEARELLLEAVEDHDGDVLMMRTSGGFRIQTNKKNMVTSQDARCQALWKGALAELLDNELLEELGHEGEVFSVTSSGYKMADFLNGGLA